MPKLLYVASLAALAAMSSSAIAQNKPTSVLPDATQPLPAGSCIQISQWTGSAFVDRKLCSNYAFSLGAALNTRSIGTSGLLTGGGDLTADRTISIAPQAACTIVANATTGSAAPTATGLGTGLSCSGGQIVVTASGTGDVVGPAGATNNIIAVFDGPTGKLIKEGGVAISGLAPATSGTAVLKGDNNGGFANAIDGTDISLITALTCSGTDKLSAVTADGTFTCTADAGGGGLTLTGIPNGSLLYDDNDVLGGVILGTGFDLTAGVLSLKTVVNIQSGTSYLVVASDSNKTIRTTNASQVTLNIGPAATLGNGFGFGVQCDSAGGCIIDPNGSELVDGAATLSLTQYQKAWIDTDGTGWRGEVGAYRDPSNASFLTSGVVGTSRGGAGLINGIMRADGTGQTSAATPGTHYAAPPSGSANTPLFDNGAGGFTNGTRSGTGTSVVTTTGTQTSGNCVTIDAFGNHIADVNPCGGAGATPGGNPGDIQYNNTGVFGGRAPSGTGTSVVTTTGTQTSGRCVTIDAFGNHIADANACGSAAAGAMTLVSTITANNTSPAITFTGLTGNDYKVTCRGVVPATSGIRILIQLSIGTTFITADYDWSSHGIELGTSTYFVSSTPADSGISIRGSTSSIGTDAAGVTLDFGLYGLATAVQHRVMGKSMSVSDTNVTTALDFFGRYTGATTAVDGVRVITNSGNLVSGSCSLYSVAS